MATGTGSELRAGGSNIAPVAIAGAASWSVGDPLVDFDGACR